MSDNNHEGMKRCSKCGEWKLATVEYFNRDNRVAGGLRSVCKECVREYYREYYNKNRDREREQWREYYQKNKDRILEYYQKNKDRKCEYTREYQQTPVGKLAQSIGNLRRKTGATIYLRDMTDEEKETLANQYVAVRTLEKTEKELLAASGKMRCSKCGLVLDFEMFCFYKSRGRYAAECKACAAKYQRKYRQKNKDYYRKYNREYRQQNKDKIKEYDREYKKNKKVLDKIESIPDNRV